MYVYLHEKDILLKLLTAVLRERAQRYALLFSQAYVTSTWKTQCLCGDIHLRGWGKLLILVNAGGHICEMSLPDYKEYDTD
jgi:hypothetical protein